MIKNIYCIRDIQSNWLNPIVDFNDSTAIRNFRNAAKQESSVIGFSPKDFVLYRIAEFDDESGVIRSIDPVVIYRGEDHVKDI